MIEKLDGIPKIVYINMASHQKRREHMESSFQKYEITNYQHFDAITPSRSLHPNLNKAEFGCMLSHLTIISDFYKNSPDDMLIVMEDDPDISSIDNWDFSWREFIEAMPDFEILQLLRNHPGEQNAKLEKWKTAYRSTAAYVITKDYAKKINEMFSSSRDLSIFPNIYLDAEFIGGGEPGPVADHALYKNFNTWSTCIFKQVLNVGTIWSSTAFVEEAPPTIIKQNSELSQYWSTKRSLRHIL